MLIPAKSGNVKSTWESTLTELLAAADYMYFSTLCYIVYSYSINIPVSLTIDHVQIVHGYIIMKFSMRERGLYVARDDLPDN